MIRTVCCIAAVLWLVGCESGDVAKTPTSPSSSPAPAPAAASRSKPAPDFTLKDLQGNSVQLSSLRGKGIVLSFWFLG